MGVRPTPRQAYSPAAIQIDLTHLEEGGNGKKGKGRGKVKKGRGRERQK